MKASCRVCQSSDLFSVIDYGDQPISQRFLANAEDQEFTHSLSLHCCESCGLIQVIDPVPGELLYQDSFYYMSASKPPPHMQHEIATLKAYSRHGTVLEVGCNDGTFLEGLHRAGFGLCVGIEPNDHTRGRAASEEVLFQGGYLQADIAVQLQAQYGHFEFVVARDVLDHLSDVNGFFGCVDQLLRPDGYLYLTFLDVEPFLRQGDCTIASEQHVNYFSIGVAGDILSRFGYEPVSVETYNWGGCTAALLARRANATVIQHKGLELIPLARNFDQAVRSYLHHQAVVIDQARNLGYEVVLYGAGWRGCRFANTFDSWQRIDYVVDDGSDRQGKFLPGCRLPIRQSTEAARGPIPVLCLLALGPEFEPAVMRRLGDSAEHEILFASITVPNNLEDELRNLNKALSRAQPVRRTP